MPAAYPLPLPGEPIPQQFKLGSLCLNNHDWDGRGQSLRYAKPRGACVICSRESALARQEQRRRTDPEFKAKQAAYVREKRSREGRAYRGKHSPEWHELRSLRWSINQCGRLPSVAQLVRDQQLAHWREHPSDRLVYVREQAKLQARWRHMTDPSYRLYHRAKSKACKVAQRGGTPTHLSLTHLWQHWCRFDHRCAYCGCSGDLEIEHVVPISKGGEHHLGNIVPACHRCNSSKFSHDALQWYKTRSYYSEARWLKIQSVLEQSRPTAQQLTLIA